MSSFLSDGVFWGYVIAVVVLLLLILFIGRHSLWTSSTQEAYYDQLARPAWGFCRSTLIILLIVAAVLLVAAMYQADTLATTEDQKQNLRIWFGFTAASLLVWGILFFGSLNFLAASYMGMILFVVSIFLYFLILMSDLTAAWLFLIPFLIIFYCVLLTREVYSQNVHWHLAHNNLYWN